MLRNHLARAQAHLSAVFHLSPRIQNEFIGIIAENVKSVLLRSNPAHVTLITLQIG